MRPARDVAIAGVATTAQTRDPAPHGTVLALQALSAALDDAGLHKSDLQGIFTFIEGWPQNAGADPGTMRHTNWAAQLGIPIRWYTGAANSGYGSGVSAILDAAAAIRAGFIDVAGVMVGQSLATHHSARTAVWTTAELQFNEWTGTYTAGQFALAARRHMHQYGTTPEQFATVAATIRNYGHINPGAVWHGKGPYTVEDVLRAPMAADPLTRLMCASVNNGGAAVIVTSAERARDLQRPVVQVLGGADQFSYPAYASPPVLEPKAGKEFSLDWVRDGFAMSGVTRDDVDVVSLYDGFASWIVMQWEMLGFCGRGEGGPFVESGVMALDGRYPTCTDGGCMSYSHMGTPALLRPIEAVRQLRIDTADACPDWTSGVHTHQPGVCRQVRDPRVALAMSMGPPTGGGQFVLLARE
jgi:acetyl-CoA acetyltransferase